AVPGRSARSTSSCSSTRPMTSRRTALLGGTAEGNALEMGTARRTERPGTALSLSLRGMAREKLQGSRDRGSGGAAEARGGGGRDQPRRIQGQKLDNSRHGGGEKHGS
ncbi:unnamed protein product, partial [Pylaiella littoralis]